MSRSRAAAPTAGAAAVGAVFVAGFNMRSVLLGVPPVLDRVRDDLHLSNAVAGLVTAVPILVLGLLALPGAAMVRRTGGAGTVTVGLVALAAGAAMRGLPGGLTVLLAGTVVLAAGIAVAQTGVPVVLQGAFPRTLQRASMVYTVGLISGEVVAAAVTRPVVAPLTGGGWRGTMVFWAVPPVAAAVLWARSTTRTRTTVPGGGRAVRRPLRPLVRSPLVRWASVLFASQSLVFFSANTWVPSTVAGGAGSAAAAVNLFVLNAAMLPVVLVLTATRRPFVRSRAFYLVASLLCVVGTVGWWGAADTAGPLFALLIGGSTATTFAGLLAYPPTVASPPDVAPFTALMLTVSYVAAFTGPPLGGLAVDHLHHRGVQFLPIVVAAVLMVVASLRLPHRARLDHDGAGGAA